MPTIGEEASQPPPSPAIPRYFNWALLTIVLLSIIPRLILAVSQYVEYDGFWHVWIAGQDNWANFIREYQANAHPPLYFPLLRLSFLLGHTQLAYRVVSLLAGTLSIWLLGRTALKAMRSPTFALLAALAYGISLQAIQMSNEVRTYMLSALFVQISFFYFLDIIAETQPISWRPRVIFVVTTTLACLTEYYALIYTGAVLLVAFALPFFYGQNTASRAARIFRALLREMATFVLILALPVWEYLVHFGAQSVAYDHLPTYYYKPDSAESVFDFLLRNLRNELNWFLPWQIPDGATFYVVLACIVLAAALTIFLLLKWRQSPNLQAIVIVKLPMTMMCAIMVGALLRAYPFGGFLRQQYVLFPFLVTCPFILVDRLLAAAQGIKTWPRWASPAIAGALAIAVTAVSLQAFEALPMTNRLLFTDQIARYNRLFPSAQAVYLDQYNLTTYFMHHHDWKWEFISPVPGNSAVDIYQLTRDGRTVTMFRDKDHWNVDLRDPLFYRRMASGMRAQHLSSATVFSMAQPAGKTRTQAQLTAYLARIDELSAAEGLCRQTLELDNYDVYAEFRAGGCSPTQP